MFCIKCFHSNTRIVNSRPHKRSPKVWRRRFCEKCGLSFTTEEIPRLVDSYRVWSPATQRESSFNPGLLVISISNAFQHDPEKGSQVAWDLMETITGLLSIGHRRRISSADVAAVTHQVLNRYDRAAAISYALQHQLLVYTKRR
ncbi:hypothetical protein EOL96_03045 [Candidatus Saccharibacteria bacterium]|nr:hypothetical protein [Candidatus Saccharibacteria bacterium]